MILVVCGCLRLFGNVFSTVSAHSDASPAIAGGALRRGPRARGRTCDEEDSPSSEIAASYSRYSSDQQDASSIDQQQRRCRDAALANGHDLRKEFEFADLVLSGIRTDRAGFQAMLNAARSGLFQVLYFESLSRLARELVISIAVLKELVDVHKVRIISTSEGVDSARAGWELMAFFRSWMHGEFLTALRSAVLRGQEYAVQNDYSVGDWCLGYRSETTPEVEGRRRGRNAKPRMRVIVHDDHARWVRQIFHWFVVDQKSLTWIARELTRQGAPKDHPQGLLDENEAAVRAFRGTDGRVRGSTKDSQRPCHLLQGLLVCRACGCGFRVSGAGGKYLGCGGYRLGRCEVRTRLRRDQAERLILDVVGDRILRNPAWQQAVLAAAVSSWEKNRAARPDEAKEVTAAIAGVNAKIARLVDAIETGSAGPEVQDQLQSRRREREELLQRQRALERETSRDSTPPTAEWVAERIAQPTQERGRLRLSEGPRRPWRLGPEPPSPPACR